MILTYSESKRRFEFRCGAEERNGNKELGRHLASAAGFSAKWLGRGDQKELVWITESPLRARALIEYASPLVRNQIKTAAASLPLPVLTHMNGTFIWSGPIEGELDGRVINFKDRYPAAVKFRFTKQPSQEVPGWRDLDRPVWWTANVDAAKHCARFADGLAKAALASSGSTIALSRALDHQIQIPAPDGLEYMGYQKAGAAYALDRFRNPHIRGVLLGDEMGLGKTIESIGVLNMCPQFQRVLIICPASLKRNWQRELIGDADIDKVGWLVRPMSVGIADSGRSIPVPDTDIVIINYEMLGKDHFTGAQIYDTKKKRMVQEKTTELRLSLQAVWDLVIVDECHRLKNDKTLRTQLTLSIKGRHWLMLSGTPLVNRPRELWTIAHHLAPAVFPKQWDFLRRYCAGGSFFDKYGGAQNLGELQEKMRTHFMCRRLKRDVLTELPPKRRQVIELPADKVKNQVQLELSAYEKIDGQTGLDRLRLKVEIAKASDNPEDYKRAVKALRSGISVAFEELSRIRRDTAMAKVPMVVEHVTEALSEGNKILLFTHHKEPAYEIAYEFPNETVMITGDSSTKERDQAERAFNYDDSVRLCIGTIGACGVGLNLQRSCSTAVFAELDWVPGNITQAEDRIHRKGQLDGVLIQHLVLEGSLDARMARVIVEKQEIADKALDTPAEVESQYALPTEMSTRNARPQDIAKAAEKITTRDIADVQLLVKSMSNGTFAPADLPLGRFLSEQKRLTTKFAALGKKLIYRYRHQPQIAALKEVQRLFKETS